MGFEKVALFGLIDADLDSTGTGSLYLSTDLPSNAMAVRETKAIAATGRRVVRFRLLGTTKGRLYSLKVAPVSGINGGVIRLYGARIWARVLPGQEWAWYVVPVPPTSEEWMPVKLPIPPVSEWAAAKLPIPPVSEWAAAKLPIPPVSEWSEAKLPIPPVSEWAAAKLPIKPTPANPEWVEIPVDA